MNYEELQITYGYLNIQELDLSEAEGLKGLYYNGNIAIHKTLTTVEKSCILAEELGHHFTSTGNILDLQKVENMKQELHARMWAYNHQIGLLGIIKAYEHGCQNKHDIAEYLNITEPFLDDAIDAYRKKYGTHVRLDNYIIYFEPCLGVGQAIE